MATQTIPREGTPPDHAVTAVEDLIRLLVIAATGRGDGRSPLSEGENEEVLLDVDVDGARYLVVRLPAPNGPQIQLSPREREIVRMVPQGHPNKIIAEVLSISTWTVCTHLRRIFAKMGVGSRAAMVARLFEKKGWTAEGGASASRPRSAAKSSHL